MDCKRRIGTKIKELRESKQISQAQLAEFIGKSTGSVGQFERGEICPSCETLSRIIEFFDADANIFFSRENKQSAIEPIILSNLISAMDSGERKKFSQLLQELSRVIDFTEINM